MKKLVFALLFIFIGLSAQAQNLADNIDCQLLLEKISATASASFDATNYQTNLLAISIDPTTINATDTVKIQVEGSTDNSVWAPINSLNVVNAVVDASGTVALYNDASMTKKLDEIQLIGAKYFRVKAEYNNSAAANITVMTLKSGKIIGK